MSGDEELFLGERILHRVSFRDDNSRVLTAEDIVTSAPQTTTTEEMQQAFYASDRAAQQVINGLISQILEDLALHRIENLSSTMQLIITTHITILYPQNISDLHPWSTQELQHFQTILQNWLDSYEMEKNQTITASINSIFAIVRQNCCILRDQTEIQTILRERLMFYWRFVKTDLHLLNHELASIVKKHLAPAYWLANLFINHRSYNQELKVKIDVFLKEKTATRQAPAIQLDIFPHASIPASNNSSNYMLTLTI